MSKGPEPTGQSRSARRPVRRLFVMLGGFLLACVVAALAISLTMTIMVLDKTGGNPVVEILALPVRALIVLAVIPPLTIIPVAIAIAIAEWRGIRAWWLHAAFGAGLAGVISQTVGFAEPRPSATALVVIGALAGLVYWAIAGRKAGRTGTPAPPA